MKLVLAAVAVALLAILAVVLLLKTGESGGALLPVAQDPGVPGLPRPLDAEVRAPVPSSLAEAGAGPSTRAAVEGTVRDAVGALLGGVRITARVLEESRGVGAPWQTTTDARGNFAVALPPDASVELAFYHSGYCPTRRRVRAPASGRLDVVLRRSTPLLGRVERREGAPVSGALVRWKNPHLALGAGEMTTTGADGRFAFRDPPRSLDLEVLAPDALPVHRLVHVARVGMGELVIVVDGGREATGTVLAAESGSGIAGATVALWYYESSLTAEGRRGGASQHVETVKTRTDGSFTLTRMPSTEDKKRPDACLWVTAPGRAPHWKVVALPERADGVKVILHPVGRVRGRVVDASGAPVPGMRVYAEAEAQLLCDDGSNLGYRMQHIGNSLLWSTHRPEAVAPFHTEREAFTDSTGTYVMHGIPCPADGGKITIAVPGGPRVTVVARSGEVAVAEDLVLPEDLFRRWHGVVRDEDSRPVAGATIKISNVRTTSDVRGLFDFEVAGNIQGPLSISVSAPGYVRFHSTFVPSRGIFAECAEGGVTVTLARAVDLPVLVVDRNQRPVPNVSMRAYLAGGLAEFAQGGPMPPNVDSGRSDDRGAALLTGVPETCDVFVYYRRRPKAPEHRKILPAVVAGAGPLRVTLEDLDLYAGTAVLTVRVIDGRTDAAFDGWVVLEATSAESDWRGLRQGPEIRLDGLSLGEWRVSVAAEGLGARSTSVELRNDQRLDLRLGQGVAISGLLSCATGPLARPVQVQARELVSKRLSVTRTDAEGRFALAGMDPGEYLLAVEPFESDAFARLPMLTLQDYASPAPVKVRVGTGTAPAPVTLPVVPVAPLSVKVVAPDAATPGAQSVWSWAQGLHFTVSDEQGVSVHAGGPSSLMTATAELLLNLPAGRYTVTVRQRGAVLGERTLAAGESWRLDTQ